MGSPADLALRPAGAILLLLLAACASQPGMRDADVVHLTPTEIREQPERLASARYVSTGQPDAAVLDAARAAGFVAVIDLRGSDESRGIDESAEVEARGMRYLALPLSTPEDATYDAANAFAAELAAIDGPVLMHCASGNRVGTLFALAARAEGASAEAALALGERAGLTRWRSEVVEKLDER
ncbi:MAG: sulfur transferase domain-containing protein [Woeseiaceae bacterium]|nr:sulfur transferase domain-containing protein [Woeseiaceae bacterium]